MNRRNPADTSSRRAVRSGAATGRASRLQRGSSLARLARATLTQLLVLAMVLAGPGTSTALAQATSGEAEAAMDRIDQLRAEIDRVEAELPESAWTQEDLAFELAFEEPDVIGAWVRDEIAFEAYRGVLRGADGTVRAEAGNAWDQSLLLATLLFDAGYTARIARTTLPDDAAESLVRSMRTREPAATENATVGEPFADEEELRETVRDVDRRTEELERELIERTTDTAGWLASNLADAGISTGGNDLSELVEDTQDYAWIEVRLAESEPWTALHPAAPEGAAWLDDLEPEATYDGELPSEVQHRFRFEAVVEQRLGSELETSTLMAGWERPVANLNGVALSYAAYPDGYLELGPGAPAEEAYAETSFVLPVFNGELAPSGDVFDLIGNVAPSDAAQSAAGGLFQNVGGAFGEAAGGVSGQEDAVALTGHWLEFTLIAPGGEEATYRRTILDRFGPERRAAGDVDGDLLPMSDAEIVERLRTQHVFMLAPGRYAPGFVRQHSLEGSHATLDYLETLWLEASEDPEALPEPPDGLEAAAAEAPLLRLYEAFDDADAALPDGILSYRPTPSLVVTTADPESERATVDIVHNERRTLEVASAGGPAPSFDGAVRAGVWESTIEGYAFAEATSVEDTPSYFAEAETQGVEVRTLAPGSVEATADLDLPEASRAAIARDLENGFAVVTPVAMPDATTVAHWWRVDPASGETLGRGADGRGNVLAGYSITKIGIAFSVLTGLIGVGACVATGGGAGCCAIDGVAYFGIGFLFALMFGSGVLALSMGVSFDLHSLAFGAAGALPSSCSLMGDADGPDRLVVATADDARPGDARPGDAACRLPSWMMRSLGPSTAGSVPVVVAPG